MELVGGEGADRGVPERDVKPFFNRIELKNAERRRRKSAASGAPRIVDFEITMTANYAI